MLVRVYDQDNVEVFSTSYGIDEGSRNSAISEFYNYFKAEYSLVYPAFGADGQSEIPFTIEDGILPASVESDAYTFIVDDISYLPNGELVIKKSGDGWKYKFNSRNDLNCEFDLQLNAIDQDGDSGTKILHINVNNPPNIRHLDSWKVEVDEGNQPYHTESYRDHNSSGKSAILVNMHGDDGKIEIGDMVITIENTTATIDKDTFMTEHGVRIALRDLDLDQETGIWTVNYEYSLNGGPLNHVGQYTENDGSIYVYETSDIDDYVTIQATSENGLIGSDMIWACIHDDEPRVSDIQPNTDEFGNSLSGTVKISFGADGAADILAIIGSKYSPPIIEAVGDADSWSFTFEDHPKLPDGTLTFTKVGDHYEYVYDLSDPAACFAKKYLYIDIKDGDGDKKSMMLTLSNPSSVSSDDTAAESSEAGYLIADDSLDDLIGADSGYSPALLTSASPDISQLTEQESLALEQAMRQVENQMS